MRVGDTIRFVHGFPASTYAASDMSGVWEPGDERVVVEGEADAGSVTVEQANRLLSDFPKFFVLVQPEAGPITEPARKAAPSSPPAARKSPARKPRTRTKKSSAKE